MTPEISIIVPIYNVEKYIRKSIESILNQTLKEIEIILVNDGSTDLSGKIAEEYAKVDSRVRVVHQENQGVSIARNHGIKMARGKYIGFVDPDDWITPNMYELLLRAAKITDAEISGCAHIIEMNNENIIKIEPFKNMVLLDYNQIRNQIIKFIISDEIKTYCWDKIYKAELLKKNNIKFPEKIPFRQDTYFCMEVFSYAKNFIYLREPLYYYRRNQGSASYRKHKDFLEMRLALHKKKFENMEKWGMTSKAEAIIGIKSLFKDLVWYIHTEVGVNKKRRLSEAISNVRFISNNEIVKYYLSSGKLTVTELKQLADDFNERMLLYLIKNNKPFLLIFWINLFYDCYLPLIKTIKNILPEKLITVIKRLKTGGKPEVF